MDNYTNLNRSLSLPGLLTLAFLAFWGPAAAAGIFATTPWTNDASSGITTGQTLWAYHFGSASTAVVNGVNVPGTGTSTNPVVAGKFSVSGAAFLFNNHANNLTTLGGNGSALMAQNFIYGGAPWMFSLEGLAPGQAYTVTLFGVGFDAPNARANNFTNGSDTILVDENALGTGNGLRVEYTFTAAASTNLMLVQSTNTSTFHTYGIALRKSLVVTSTNNAGPGTLRQTVLDAGTLGGANTLNFASNLSGLTITLSNEIVISNNLAIDAGSLTNGLALSGSNLTRIFFVNTNQTAALFGLTLTAGNGSGAVSSDNGGAIENYGNLSLTSCTLYSNSCGEGGAIESEATLSLTGCTLFGNSSFEGGAVRNSAGTLAAFTQCTFASNSATYGGAIACQGGGLLAMTNCTLSLNQSLGGGGGGAIDNYNGASLKLNACIIAGNTAASASGPELWMEDGPVTASYCLLGDGANSLVTNGVNGNLVGNSAARMNALLSPLGNYGGHTKTMRPLPGSPAIDAGVNTPGLTTDQRGYPRPADGDGNGTAVADIGAVEFQLAVVNTNSDSGPGSLRQAILTAGTDTVAFDPSLSGKTIAVTSEIIFSNNNITIDASGLGGRLTLNGGNQTRIFTVYARQTAVLRGLTFTGGNGVGLLSSGFGGAILNGGTLSLTECTVTGSAAANGGALNNNGILTVSNCTFSGNISTFQSGAIQNQGFMDVFGTTFANNRCGTWGGVILTAGFLSLEECTLANNQAGVYGGGILVYQGTTTLAQCTVANNQAGQYGGGILLFSPGTLILTNSIIANNSAAIAGADFFNNGSVLIRGGANIVPLSTTVTGSTTTGPAPITSDPLLAALGNYGGPTQTMPPLPGSPAADAAIALPEFTVDQRGSVRTFGVAPDLGAVESGGLWVQNTNDDGPGSLRAILTNAAIAATHSKVVLFQPSLSGATIGLSNQIVLTDTNGVTLTAAALPGGIQISGQGKSRVFYVNSGAVAAFDSLTIAKGLAPAGAFSNNGGGAGVFCRGQLSLLNCAIVSNTVAGSSSTGSFAAGVAAYGADVRLTNCTIAFNQVLTGSFGQSQGGAFYNYIGRLTCDHCTIASNLSLAVNGGFNNSGVTSFHSTLLANGNTDFYDFGGGVSLGNNLLIDGSSSLFTNGVNGDQIGSFANPLNALLAPLGNYGGTTQTMPPLPGSPAIDKGGLANNITDQRGYPRPVGLAADVGAVEGIYNAAGPGKITGFTSLPNGVLKLSFTNLTDASFAVVSSTNLSQPLNTWTPVGFASEVSSGGGRIQFTDLQPATSPPRFYRVRSP